ncbi:hypothetical protein E4U54_006558 [Claviceps lovelessii]|nr:hypothetical protein E4U54_006558 [Claviceps lovelessii]
MPTPTHTHGRCRQSTTADDADDTNNQGSCTPTAIASSRDGSSDHEVDVPQQQQQQRFPVCETASSIRTARSVAPEADGTSNQRDLEEAARPEDGADEKQGRAGTKDSDSWDADADPGEWDGPDDAQNPKCWAVGKKWTAVVCGRFLKFGVVFVSFWGLNIFSYVSFLRPFL